MNRVVLIWLIAVAVLATVAILPQSQWATRNHVGLLIGEFSGGGDRNRVTFLNLRPPTGIGYDPFSSAVRSHNATAPPENSVRGLALAIRRSEVRYAGTYPREIRQWIRDAIAKEPDNSFWWMNLAAAESVDQDRPAQLAALRKAVQCSQFDDHSRTEYDNVVAIREDALGYRGELFRTQDAFGIFQNYVGSLATMVHRTKSKDLELRRLWARLAARMVENTGRAGCPRWLSLTLMNEALDVRVTPAPGQVPPPALEREIRKLANDELPRPVIERTFAATERISKSLFNPQTLETRVGAERVWIGAVLLLVTAICAMWTYLLPAPELPARELPASGSLERSSKRASFFGAALAGLFAATFWSNGLYFLPLGYLLIGLARGPHPRWLFAVLTGLGMSAVVPFMQGNPTPAAANILVLTLLSLGLAVLDWRLPDLDRLEPMVELVSLIWTIVALFAMVSTPSAAVTAAAFVVLQLRQGRLCLPRLPSWVSVPFVAGLGGAVAYSASWELIGDQPVARVGVMVLIAVWVGFQLLRKEHALALACMGLVYATLYGANAAEEVRLNAIYGAELQLMLNKP